MKRNWKAGVCAALCSAMVFTGIGPVLTPYLENAVVYADENENSGVKKVFTADQLKVAETRIMNSQMDSGNCLLQNSIIR